MTSSSTFDRARSGSRSAKVAHAPESAQHHRRYITDNEVKRMIEMERESTESFDDRFEEPGVCEPISCCCLMAFPCWALCGLYTVNQGENVVLTRWGKFSGLITEPGIHWSNSCGLQRQTVSVKKINFDSNNVKVADADGAPLNVGCIVTYEVANPVRATFNVEASHRFISEQVQSTLRSVVATFPYDSDGNADIVCLRSDTAEVAELCRLRLQNKVDVAGIRVISVGFNEIAYSTEIAAGMLRRQQATALVAARQTIVEGAVEIAATAVEKLNARNVKMSDERKAAIVGSLLVTICSDSSVHPTVSV